MSRKFKYIIYDDCFPVLFTEADTHKTRAGFNKVTSAGFGQLIVNEQGEIEAQCWGESVSLNVKANPEFDSAIITRMFNE